MQKKSRVRTAVPLVMALAAAPLLSVSLAACGEEEGTAEQIGESIDKTVEEAGDKVEEAGDEIERKVE